MKKLEQWLPLEDQGLGGEWWKLTGMEIWEYSGEKELCHDRGIDYLSVSICQNSKAKFSALKCILFYLKKKNCKLSNYSSNLGRRYK